MTRTRSEPLASKKMWRQLLARMHPDAGGSHEGFLFVQALREHILTGGGPVGTQNQQEATPQPGPESDSGIIHEEGRVPFPKTTDFDVLTAKALNVARKNWSHPIAGLIRLLEGCGSLPHLHREESRGATYKQAAYAAHLFGLHQEHQRRWYALCEFVPLSQRHLGHLIKKLKEERLA